MPLQERHKGAVLVVLGACIFAVANAVAKYAATRTPVALRLESDWRLGPGVSRSIYIGSDVSELSLMLLRGPIVYVMNAAVVACRQADRREVRKALILSVLQLLGPLEPSSLKGRFIQIKQPTDEVNIVIQKALGG